MRLRESTARESIRHLGGEPQQVFGHRLPARVAPRDVEPAEVVDQRHDEVLGLLACVASREAVVHAAPTVAAAGSGADGSGLRQQQEASTARQA